MQHLIAFARRQGLLQFDADVLIGNLPMLAVFRASRLPMIVEQDGDSFHVTLSLELRP
jgi:hypothetical protein